MTDHLPPSEDEPTSEPVEPADTTPHDLVDADLDDGADTTPHDSADADLDDGADTTPHDSADAELDDGADTTPHDSADAELDDGADTAPQDRADAEVGAPPDGEAASAAHDGAHSASPSGDADSVEATYSDDELLAAAASDAAPTGGETEPADDGPAASGHGFAPPGPADGGADTPPPPPPHQSRPPFDPPPGGGAPPYRRLYRSRSDRRLGGVAGGLANYLGIDPTLVRIAFVVLALTGVSILAYIIGWIVIPKHPATEAEAIWNAPHGTDRNLAIAVGLGSLGLAVALLSGSWTLLAIVLIGGGLWLLTDQPRSPGAGSSDGAPPPRRFAGQEPASSSGGASWQPGTTATMSPPATAPASSTTRGPQRITRAVLAALALLGALGVAASTGDWWDVSATRMLGIGVLIIGTGVFLGAITDLGARWLIPLGLVGLVLLAPVSFVDDVIDDGVGEVTFRPSSIAELESEYRHGVGEMIVDLRSLDLEGVSRTVDVELGFGEVTVYLPETAGGIGRMDADAGELTIDLDGIRGDRVLDGVTIESGRFTLPGDAGDIDLDISVGFGVANLRADG